MAVGRPIRMSGAMGRQQKSVNNVGIDFGAVGKSIGDFFNNVALPWIRDEAIPTVLGVVAPPLKNTYNIVKDGIMNHAPADQILAAAGGQVLNEVVPQGLDLLATVFPPALPVAEAYHLGQGIANDVINIVGKDNLQGSNTAANMMLDSFHQGHEGAPINTLGSMIPGGDTILNGINTAKDVYNMFNNPAPAFQPTPATAPSTPAAARPPPKRPSVDTRLPQMPGGWPTTPTYSSAYHPPDINSSKRPRFK